MRITRAAIIISFLLTAVILSWALLATSSMRHQFHNDPTGTAMTLVIGTLVCGWPWLKAFVAVRKGCKEIIYAAALTFAVLSVAIAGAFASTIADSPADGIGWYIITCILLIWCIYAVIFWIGNKIPDT